MKKRAINLLYLVLELTALVLVASGGVVMASTAVNTLSLLL